MLVLDKKSRYHRPKKHSNVDQSINYLVPALKSVGTRYADLRCRGAGLPMFFLQFIHCVDTFSGKCIQISSC